MCEMRRDAVETQRMMPGNTFIIKGEADLGNIPEIFFLVSQVLIVTSPHLHVSFCLLYS